MPDVGGLSAQVAPPRQPWRFDLEVGLPIPIDITVDMDGDNISATQSGAKLGYPPITGNFDALWGPHVRGNVVRHLGSGPGQGPLVLAGLGWRRIFIEGQASSPLQICSSEDPRPCHEQERKITTHTTISADASYEVRSLLGHLGVGWEWTFAPGILCLQVLAGYTWPLQNYRTIATSVRATSDGSVGDEADQEALGELQSRAESGASHAIEKAFRPYEVLGLPLLTVGVHFPI